MTAEALTLQNIAEEKVTGFEIPDKKKTNEEEKGCACRGRPPEVEKKSVRSIIANLKDCQA